MKHLRWLIAIILFTGLSIAQAGLPGGPAAGLAWNAARTQAFVVKEQTVDIVDTTDAAAPTVVNSQIQANARIRGLAYDESRGLLFLAAEDGGVEVWNVANASAPQHLNTFDVLYFGTPVPALDIELSGNFAYVAASEGGGHILDVSDPLNPVDRGLFSIQQAPVRAVHLDDGFLYSAGFTPGRFTVQADGSLRISNAFPYSFLTTEITADGNLAFVHDGNTLTIHAADASGFPILSSITTQASGMAASAGYLYVAWSFLSQTEISVYDVRTPGAPSLVGTIPGTAGAAEMVIDRPLALVRSSDAAMIVDVSDPAAPTVLGSTPLVAGSDTGGADSGSGDTPANQPPVAVASDQTVSARATVLLDASGSFDPDGQIVSYAWRQTSGSSVRLANADTAVAQFRAPRVSRFRGTVQLGFEVTVTDNDGASAAKQVQVTVNR